MRAVLRRSVKPYAICLCAQYALTSTEEEYTPNSQPPYTLPQSRYHCAVCVTELGPRGYHHTVRGTELGYDATIMPYTVWYHQVVCGTELGTRGYHHALGTRGYQAVNTSCSRLLFSSHSPFDIHVQVKSRARALCRRYAMSGTAIRYMRCPAPTRMRPLARYSQGSSLGCCYAMPGTHIRYASTPPICLTISGTDMVYASTTLLRDARY
eukprot:3941952-Rhodomonas_salina.2